MDTIYKRTVPQNGRLQIQVPKHLQGKELDVIIRLSEKEAKAPDPVEYRGALNLDLSNTDIDKEIQRGRDE